MFTSDGQLILNSGDSWENPFFSIQGSVQLYNVHVRLVPGCGNHGKVGREDRDSRTPGVLNTMWEKGPCKLPYYY